MAQRRYTAITLWKAFRRKDWPHLAMHLVLGMNPHQHRNVQDETLWEVLLNVGLADTLACLDAVRLRSPKAYLEARKSMVHQVLRPQAINAAEWLAALLDQDPCLRMVMGEQSVPILHRVLQLAPGMYGSPDSSRSIGFPWCACCSSGGRA